MAGEASASTSRKRSASEVEDNSHIRYEEAPSGDGDEGEDVLDESFDESTDADRRETGSAMLALATRGTSGGSASGSSTPKTKRKKVSKACIFCKR